MNRDRVRVGVSSCLLGHRVRYDGGHKKLDLLTDVFVDWVDWVPVCPEVELGLGTPRDPIDLVRVSEDVHMVMGTTGTDLTDAMCAFAGRRIAGLVREGLAGYVLKSRSPSCALDDATIRDERGRAIAAGKGLFAERLVRAVPGLPVVDEARLTDASTLADFLDHAFAFAGLPPPPELHTERR